jgi:hypothetical protein
MKHFVQKNLNTIINTIIVIGVILAVLGGAYAYYINETIR